MIEILNPAHGDRNGRLGDAFSSERNLLAVKDNAQLQLAMKYSCHIAGSK